MPDTCFLLALSAVDQNFVPGDKDLIPGFLAEAGLISTPWRGRRYLAGEHFLGLLSFTGCSPFLNFDADDGLGFCHIEIPEVSDSPQFLYHPHLPDPLCPDCRCQIRGWKNTIPDAPESLRCPQCQRDSVLGALVWRQRLVCFSRAPVLIWNIGEGEAVPTMDLLEGLQGVTGTAWRYSYVSTGV